MSDRSLNRIFALSLLLTLFASAAHAATAPPDSLGWYVDRWATSVGGWSRLDKVAGAHLHARTVSGGVPGTAEAWITRDGRRVVIAEGADSSESVRQGGSCWWRDWNGKTLALGGRDRTDAVTESFVWTLALCGPSRKALAGAGAHDAGDDSSHALRIVHLSPPDGIPCDLYLDRASGRPVRAVRRPYDDDEILAFEDWRAAGGVTMPFRIVETGEDDARDSTTVVDATPLAAAAIRPFTRPADGPSDVRFTSGDGSLGIPFNFENDHIMVECRVNGSKPIWFMFDSGADVTLINTTRIEELGLTSFGAARTSGGGGSTDYAFTHADRLELPGVAMLGQRLGVVDCSGLERLYGMPLGGLLGYDFASRFTIVVDYDTHTMNLYSPEAGARVARGTRVPFVLEEGHPHVRGEIVVDDGGPIPADFIIDSGAAESANLTAPFVREHRLLERARKTPAGAPSVTPGVEKQFFAQTTVRGRLRRISIGDVSVTDIPVNLQQGTTGAYASASFSGTIGERILSRFTTTYDYPRSALFLAPNAEAAKPFPPRTSFGMSLISDGPDYTTFTVSGVRKESAADSAGFRKGDVIVALDGKPASAWRLAELRTAITQEGSRHTAQVRRDGQPDATLEFLVRLVSIEDR